MKTWLGREDGVALIVALMALLLMTALGIGLLLVSSTETLVAGRFRDSQEASYAAEAALERAAGDLESVVDWSDVVNGGARSAFVDGPPGGSRTLSDHTSLDLTQVLNLDNCQKTSACSGADMDAVSSERPWGANNPRWQAYAYGPLKSLLPGSTIDSPYYVVVFAADDPSENDGDPLQDGTKVSNPGRGVVMLRAEAFGPGGARSSTAATLARAVGGGGEDAAGDPHGPVDHIAWSGVRSVSWRAGR